MYAASQNISMHLGQGTLAPLRPSLCIDFLFSDDALVEELTKQLSPRLIIASDEIRMLDISLGQGTTHRHTIHANGTYASRPDKVKNIAIINLPLRMHRAGYSSRFVCLSVSLSVTVLHSQMRHFQPLKRAWIQSRR